ncbi:hypothetical protein GY45DRAFT_739490 [Cubamyces sp. BRFM 1775]|nr:hypothetical protein GY45DRAFT_739490 [Cubamyces sp. BRFM 1775]
MPDFAGTLACPACLQFASRRGATSSLSGAVTWDTHPHSKREGMRGRRCLPCIPSTHILHALLPSTRAQQP